MNVSSSKRRVAALISDHGNGHAARMSSILNCLGTAVDILIISAVPLDFFRENLHHFNQIEFVSEKLSVGCFQKSGVEIDVEKTLDHLKVFWSDMNARQQRLTSFIHNWKADLILFDIPEIAPLIAHDLHLPSFVVSNFGWNFIYEEFMKDFPDFSFFVNKITEAYALTSAAICIPFSCDNMECFHCPKIQVPSLIGLRSSADKYAVHQILVEKYTAFFDNTPSSLKFMLLSFGGHSFPIEDVSGWQIPHDWVIVILSNTLSDSRVPGSLVLTQAFLTAQHLKYIDLVAACDVVVLKTGYGIVSEVILHEVPVLYVDRPGWREHQYLVDALHRHTLAAYIPFEKVMKASSELFATADELLREERKAPFPNDGAERIAKFVLEFDMSSSSYPKSL